VNGKWPNGEKTMTAAPRVLVVEDEPNIRELLATSLRFAGFEVHVAGDGATAIHLALALPKLSPGLCVLSKGTHVCALPKQNRNEMRCLSVASVRPRCLLVNVWRDADERPPKRFPLRGSHDCAAIHAGASAARPIYRRIRQGNMTGTFRPIFASI